MYDTYVCVISDADIQFSLQLADTVGTKKLDNISLNFETYYFTPIFEAVKVIEKHRGHFGQRK